MININFTLLVQLANFLILLVILNFLLFKPILRVLDEREKLVRESAEIKERLTRLAEENIQEYEARMTEAKQKAMTIRTGVRSEVMSLFRQRVQEAKTENLAKLDETRKELARRTESLRGSILVEARDLAAEIAGKLLGRRP